MKTTFNQDYLLKNCGCYSQDEAKALSFMQKPEFTLLDIVNSEIPIKDKFWFVVRKCELTDLQKKKIAIGCAEITLAIYENKHPEDKRPRKAIEAAKQYLEGEISLGYLLEYRRAAAAAAADAAAAAAYAYAYADADAAAAAAAYAYAYADAADAAAYAAAAASAAAAAAADAAAAAAAYAAAAAAAATYAYADAYADAYKQSLLNFLVDFVEKEGNI